MTRTYLKKNTAIGTIQKQMVFTPNCINLYTITKSGSCYDGSIPHELEHAQSLEWKERGFSEVQ